MFNIESYNKIFNTVWGDIKEVEKLLQCAVSEDNSFCAELCSFLMSPSKRIRSVLIALYLRAAGEEIDSDVILIMYIVELIHNASLIHDDVIDDDSIRRDNKTMGAIFGSKMAVIAGDYLLSMVMKKLTAFGKAELFDIFSKTIQDMCEGEISQYTNSYKIPEIDEYISKTYQKTGSLFEAAVMAAVFAKTGVVDKQAGEFGKYFGIAFQIRDDLNNVLNSAKDIDRGIYNAPVIFSGSINISETGIEKTEYLLNNYLDKAGQCLARLENNVYKSTILELLELLHG